MNSIQCSKFQHLHVELIIRCDERKSSLGKDHCLLRALVVYLSHTRSRLGIIYGPLIGSFNLIYWLFLNGYLREVLRAIVENQKPKYEAGITTNRFPVRHYPLVDWETGGETESLRFFPISFYKVVEARSLMHTSYPWHGRIAWSTLRRFSSISKVNFNLIH